MRKAQAEIDDVLGDQQLQAEDLSKFPYLTGARCFPYIRFYVADYLIQPFSVRLSALVPQLRSGRSAPMKIQSSEMASISSRKDRG